MTMLRLNAAALVGTVSCVRKGIRRGMDEPSADFLSRVNEKDRSSGCCSGRGKKKEDTSMYIAFYSGFSACCVYTY